MATINTEDGTQIYYKDWGSGQPVVFSHGWPLSADDWDPQMFFFASRGFRCIAHDRRGHGRSSQTWSGNEMDTYADDLVTLAEKLELSNAIHVGHSTGGGEVARYIGRHGGGRAKGRIAKAVLIVEFAKQQEEQGLSSFDAAIEAARLRLRPILMTSFAFILGVVPLIVASGAGAEMRQALGTVVFYGMVGVTFFGLFLTPVFFYVIRRLTGSPGPGVQPGAARASANEIAG